MTWHEKPSKQPVKNDQLECSCFQLLFEINALLNTDHGKEDAKLRAHIHIVSVGEDKVFATFLFAGKNYCDLLSRNRQNWKDNAVELVKTAPRSRLSQTWKLDTRHSVANHCRYFWNSSQRAKIVFDIFRWHKIFLQQHNMTKWFLPLKILPRPLKSIWSEQLKTTTYFPRQRPMSFIVSVLP